MLQRVCYYIQTFSFQFLFCSIPKFLLLARNETELSVCSVLYNDMVRPNLNNIEGQHPPSKKKKNSRKKITCKSNVTLCSLLVCTGKWPTVSFMCYNIVYMFIAFLDLNHNELSHDYDSYLHLIPDETRHFTFLITWIFFYCAD